MKVIVENSYGSNFVYVATLDNAFKLFEKEMLDENHSFLEIEKDVYYASESALYNKAKSILTDKEVDGVLISADMKASLLLFLVENKISIEKGSQFSSFEFRKYFSFDDLPFFKEFNKYKDKAKIEFINDWEYDKAIKYDTIKNNRFKEDISEERIISYILRFLNEITRSDVSYSLEELKEVV